jgi:hypothetical protein
MMMNMNNLTQVDRRQTVWIGTAVLLIILAGIIHLVIIPEHWDHAPAHGLFFGLVGVLQIGWGIAFWKRPSPTLYYAGFLLAGGLISLWVITRLWTAPFHPGPEPVDLAGIVCKLAELLALFSLAALAFTGTAVGQTKRLVVASLGLLLALSIVAGAGTYGVAIAAEPLFPGLVADHDHDHDHDHRHDAGHDHGHDADDEHGDSHDTDHDHEHSHDADHDHGHGHDHGHDAEDEDQ